MPRYLKFVLVLFVVHAGLRFGGLINPMFYPLSMMLLWPLPWVLASREERRQMGFRMPLAARWWLQGPLVALGMLAVCVGLAWGIGGGE